MKKIHYFIALLVVALSFKLRMFEINAPLGDWHSWRQSDTASVALEYTKNGIDLLHPTYQDISSIPSGLDNPTGYRFVEFPIISAIHATVSQALPGLDFVVLGRLLTIATSSFTVYLIYLLTFHISGSAVAFFSSFMYAVIPYNIYYGRVILPEPWMVMFAMGFLYAFVRWVNTQRVYFYLISILSLTLALLMKPTALIMLLPAGIYLLDNFKKVKKHGLIAAVVALAISLVPLIAWRSWMKQFPEGIPANTWLFNGNGIRFKGAFFRWIFGERISKMILGYWGLIPVAAGLLSLKIKQREDRFYLGLLLGSLIYLFVLATGNVQHDYYQILIVPSLSILYGLGINWILKLRKGLNMLIPVVLLTLAILLNQALGWYEIRGFFNINNPSMVKAGQKADEILPKDAKVIVPYLGDTAFLFQTKRQGWPVGGDIQDKIERGAQYYITSYKGEHFAILKEKYTTIYEEDEFAIIDLTQAQ